ncbi:hypothetical protein, variant 2 [Aphanomyces invadans]|uniref:Uncharacterized protein n=1 Tax=Aphanomyces invadans TaxID=157072 RepID=A0A024UGT1_9STRA|nr:hypothetical protein H310_03363 [Aphanomyces invadans]XP_008865413.1 hypothetical protein, variant 1 [Aphanomyces invadans]XP_008865414.1 hypothetical protein, variant 2 [Aphanomyces invadans]ETW05635.1 hypothetical protein H310_03363 [Aphanomyces invadans]ETW05636.1 hypothetical protein, variant 1 [Aphanomyces invadans]ETW05637.1 hypothetical protein, variant 2 [Aphanomyces invadans]|eukprot:XP_008865412.1 hypothetical protein H310_03363 [Aphanomyces invadans]
MGFPANNMESRGSHPRQCHDPRRPCMPPMKPRMILCNGRGDVNAAENSDHGQKNMPTQLNTSVCSTWKQVPRMYSWNQSSSMNRQGRSVETPHAVVRHLPKGPHRGLERHGVHNPITSREDGSMVKAHYINLIWRSRMALAVSSSSIIVTSVLRRACTLLTNSSRGMSFAPSFSL